MVFQRRSFATLMSPSYVKYRALREAATLIFDVIFTNQLSSGIPSLPYLMSRYLVISQRCSVLLSGGYLENFTKRIDLSDSTRLPLKCTRRNLRVKGYRFKLWNPEFSRFHLRDRFAFTKLIKCFCHMSLRVRKTEWENRASFRAETCFFFLAPVQHAKR